MPVTLDFVSDFVAYLRKDLVAAGFADAGNPNELEDKSVGIAHCNAVLRSIFPRPRDVRFAPRYQATYPRLHDLKIRVLLRKIRRGGDLRPLQSRALVYGKLRNDKMLFEWGIHHLHLAPEGSDLVLMCRVTETTVFAIGFWPHKNWINEEIAEAMIDAWPEEFESRELKHMLPPSTRWKPEHRKNLRDKNVNVPFLHPTTGKQYVLGGLTSAGRSMEATLRWSQLVQRLRAIEKQVLPQLSLAQLDGRLVAEFDDDRPVRLRVPGTGDVIPIRSTR